MISRVAESCFWLHRHLERADTLARLLKVNEAFLLDVDIPDAQGWRPLLIITGEEERFLGLVGEEAADDGEQVQEYLAWEEENPVSIFNSLYWARENARTIRETISLEMWQVVNELWLWVRGGPGRRLYNRERAAFYDRIKQACQLFHGATHDTMLHGEPFDFMRLGLALERAGQTARALDLKHHALGPPRGREGAAETAEWVAILRSCSAYEPFFKCSPISLSGPAVAEFLLFEPYFPRSVLHCLERAENFLDRIRPSDDPAVGQRTAQQLAEVLKRIREHDMDGIIETGIHEELTWLVEGIAGVCTVITRDFFQSDVPAEAASA